MEEQRNDLHLGSVSAVESMDKVFVFSCPYLGTREDSDTSLAYPSPANHCFRSESAISIDLEHQETYCLSDQHHTCHVFQMANSAGTEDVPVLERKAPRKRKRRVSLYALPLILVLILLAAIIWWPAPGTTIQESLVRGAQNGSEVTGGVTLTGKPDAEPAEVAEAVEGKAGVASGPADTAEPAGLNDSPQQQQPDTGGLGANAIGDRDTSNSARNEDPASISNDQPEESQSAFAGPAEDSAQNMGTTMAQDESSVESLEESESAVQAADEVVAESESETIVEETGQSIDTSPASIEASVTDNYEAEETSFEVVDRTILGQPSDDAYERLLETETVEETEDSVQLLTSGLPVISVDAAPVSAPQVETVSVDNAGERVILIGPVASSALSLDDSSDKSNTLLVYQQAGDGAVLTELANKQFVTLLGRDVSGLWLNVRLQDGREGWINASDSGATAIATNVAEPPISAAGSNTTVATTSYPVIRSAYVDTGALNLRTGPGVEYEAFTIIGKGQIVGLVGRRTLGPWVRVRLDDGTEGWVNSSLLAPFS